MESKQGINVSDVVEKINSHGENKILLAIYENKIEQSLAYCLRTDSEQLLKLYAFLKFYIKQIEKDLDQQYQDMYFGECEEEEDE